MSFPVKREIDHAATRRRSPDALRYYKKRIARDKRQPSFGRYDRYNLINAFFRKELTINSLVFAFFLIFMRKMSPTCRKCLTNYCSLCKIKRSVRGLCGAILTNIRSVIPQTVQPHVFRALGGGMTPVIIKFFRSGAFRYVAPPCRGVVFFSSL